jgi:uncharacterized RDD family membrane protein YckC
VIDPPPRTSPGWRRVAAFAVDYGVILAYLGLLTLPVTLWFAGWEAGPGGATPGKRMLGLRVVTTGGERLAGPGRCSGRR